MLNFNSQHEDLSNIMKLCESMGLHELRQWLQEKHLVVLSSEKKAEFIQRLIQSDDSKPIELYQSLQQRAWIPTSGIISKCSNCSFSLINISKIRSPEYFNKYWDIIHVGMFKKILLYCDLIHLYAEFACEISFNLWYLESLFSQCSSLLQC